MSPDITPDDTFRVVVLSIGKRAAFHDTTVSALTDLASASGHKLTISCHGVSSSAGHGQRRPEQSAYAHVLAKAGRYLSAVIPTADIHVVAADTAESAARAVAAMQHSHRIHPQPIVLIDAEGSGVGTGPFESSLNDISQSLTEVWPAHLHTSPEHIVVYTESLQYDVQMARPYLLRHMPEERWTLAGDLVCVFTDHLQRCLSSATVRTAVNKGRSALAIALHQYLTQQAGPSWGLHYYTGSVVSSFIDDLDRIATTSSNPVLRGPSEHSLACGALARWQLDEAPYLIVVTSGMVDEFRGTLANLRDSHARGFIVCADSPSSAWYPFQGTVHHAEDSRAVLAARDIAHVYMEDPAQLRQDLEKALEAYAQGRGPVVILATPAVLNATEPLEPFARTPRPPNPRAQVVREDHLAPIVDIVNRDPGRLLWQVGSVTDEAADLTYDIAHRAGIGLTDSLTRPGNVSQYRDGHAVPEYLGTLGLYGFSSRVYDYLHCEGRLRRRAEQCLFFLGSRLGEAATPFSPRHLRRLLRIVQVTEREKHLSPFADHPLLADTTAFLRAVRERLDVDPGTLVSRRQALASARESPSDALHALPVLPMSANYFFHQLRQTLELLIKQLGYSYTGVYDVGRGGLSAVRNLPRTGRGFSGWYGRALMGDALQAVPAIALTREDNVLAFVGDGASQLVPDIVPTLVQQVCLYGRQLHRNLTVFRLIDGGHSVIRSYHEGRSGAEVSRQMQLVHLLEPEWTKNFGPLTVNHRHLTHVTQAGLGETLLQQATVNICSVPLTHNNEGDGLSLLSSLGWQRDELSELSITMARTATRNADQR